MIPRWYQEEAIWSLFEYFSSKDGNPVIALPTGTGKSLVIALFLKKMFELWPTERVLLLTHVKELIQQNALEVQKVWPTAPLGIYSAGLNQRTTMLPIIFGGIASVDKNPKLFGWRDLIIIDECHLLGPNEDTMYQETIKVLREINPKIKIIGLSATPFRLKQGLLTDGGLFTDICYDCTGVESFNRLIAEGYISPLIPKRTNTVIDLSNVGMTASEFNGKQAEAAVDTDEITLSAVRETCELGWQRNTWLTFGAGIQNVEHLTAIFNSFGVPSVAVHSKNGSKENDRRILAYKAGEYRNLVSMNKFTVGFNHPPIDLIADLQPTNSPGKHVQKCGRGTRPSPETHKENCLFLDFAGNTKRNGPINDPRIPNKPGQGNGNVPIRICVCGTYNHAAARFCVSCGIEFAFDTKIFKTARTDEIIRTDAPIFEMYDVKFVLYGLHEKKVNGVVVSPPSIKVTYVCGLQRFFKWVALEGPGLAGKIARDWWRQHHNEEPPATTYLALKRTTELRQPKRIRVWVNKKYPEVMGYEY